MMILNVVTVVLRVLPLGYKVRELRRSGKVFDMCCWVVHCYSLYL